MCLGSLDRVGGGDESLVGWAEHRLEPLERKEPKVMEPLALMKGVAK